MFAAIRRASSLVSSLAANRATLAVRSFSYANLTSLLGCKSDRDGIGRFGPSRRRRERRAANLSGAMLGLPFQPAWCERDWAFTCGACRTQSGIAAGLPFHPCTPRLGPGLG